MRTPLSDRFHRRGIETRELAPGIQVPWRFSDPASEHHATRSHAGLFDFSFMACMEVAGAGALALLHACQTRTLSELAGGRIRYTLLLRDDGTVLNDATVWRVGAESFLLFTGRRSDLEHVTKPAADFDVRLEDRTDALAIVALQGPLSREILARCLDFDRTLSYFAFTETRFAGERCLVARIGYSGEAGYEIVLPAALAAGLWEAICSAGTPAGLRECGFAAADTLRIEAGHILFSNELAFAVTPRELGLERLVEVEPRRTQRPREARRLVGLLLDELPAAVGSADSEASLHEVTVTSACLSPTLGRPLGLGYIPCGQARPGTRICDGAIRATVAPLPFYDPGKRRPRSFD